MSRKGKVKLNNLPNLESRIQEVYDDSCLQINHSQGQINILSSVKCNDVDDYTKVAKEVAGLLKIKDSSIKIKLDIAKLQADILKHNGDVESTMKDRQQSNDVGITEFDRIHQLINEDKQNS